MAPINLKGSNLNREIYSTEQPRARWFFVCEGSETEQLYFEGLFDILDGMGLPIYIEGIYAERTGGDETASHPKKLLEHADGIKNGTITKGINKNGAVVEYDFNEETDKIVIVFDTDIYKDDEDGHLAYLDEVAEKGYVPAVTYPSFALYLLLHREDAYDELVAPNEEKILENRKVSNRYTHVEKLFSKNYGINPKTGKKIQALAQNHDIAKVEEQHLNNDPASAIGHLTSNIGVVINQFKNAK